MSSPMTRHRRAEWERWGRQLERIRTRRIRHGEHPLRNASSGGRGGAAARAAALSRITLNSAPFGITRCPASSSPRLAPPNSEPATAGES
eukprot:281683-Prymnesium_polylepis.1